MIGKIETKENQIGEEAEEGIEEEEKEEETEEEAADTKIIEMKEMMKTEGINIISFFNLYLIFED